MLIWNLRSCSITASDFNTDACFALYIQRPATATQSTFTAIYTIIHRLCTTVKAIYDPTYIDFIIIIILDAISDITMFDVCRLTKIRLAF